MTETEKMTRIQVNLPLPMDVAGTVMRVIGMAYPEALMEGRGRSMTFLIPEGARPRKGSKTKAKPEVRGDVEAELLEIGPQGISITTPEALAAASLDIMRTSFEQFPDAKNYLEQRCYDRATNRGYVMTFQRAEGNTPHEMRKKAEDKLARIEGALKLLYPDDMTPSAKNVLTRILEEES
ncbi:hypothetical protein [Arthrobacter sp. SAFR-014]|uniref:hypothetical protein n=1 Tax=unclassified Arthrobacter TaxID=235627 RepID=UPI003F7CA693